RRAAAVLVGRGDGDRRPRGRRHRPGRPLPAQEEHRGELGRGRELRPTLADHRRRPPQEVRREDPPLLSRLRGQLRPPHGRVRDRGRLDGPRARGGEGRRPPPLHPPPEGGPMNWFPVFLYLFAIGTGASLLAVPYKQIGKYYFSFHS